MLLRIKIDQDRLSPNIFQAERNAAYNDVDNIYEQTADPGTGGKHPIVAALPEGCLKDNKLPEGIIDDSKPKVHMPPINNFKPKQPTEAQVTPTPAAPTPPPIETIPGSEATKKQTLWTPPKPVVKEEPPVEENLTPLEKLHKEAIERAKASGQATDPKSILSIKSSSLQPQIVSPPESHTFAGKMTRQYANIDLAPRFPTEEVTPPPRNNKKPGSPPEIAIERQWRSPDYQNQVRQEILDKRKAEEEFRRHQEEARYDTHTYVNLNPISRRPELPSNPPSLSGSS